MDICICGGGNLGHVLIGVLSSKKGINVHLLTRNPNIWQSEIVVKDINNKEYIGKLNTITDDPSVAIPNSDMVILCLPGFSIKEELLKIRNFLSPFCNIGSIVSSTGFFFIAQEVLSDDTKLFGFQRVPYIARVKEYGKSADLLGYKQGLNLAVKNIGKKEKFRIEVENLFDTPTALLNNYLEASLTNSNPLLHTSRLYSLWKDRSENDTYSHEILFYEEWTDSTSELLMAMDCEFMELLDSLPVDKTKIPSILDYYESKDIKSLTEKIKSIHAFKEIKAPMKKKGKEWVLDFNSRYFTEDFPFGLHFIKQLTDKYRINAPNINRVYEWGMKITDSHRIIK